MHDPVLHYARHRTLWEHIPHENHDLAHDQEHVLRVYRWSVQLAAENDINPDLAGAAALLHDVVNIPKESPERSQASEASAQEGLPYLKSAGYSQEECDIIYDAIRTCSWSRGLAPVNDVGAVLQDADRLDAIGAIGIMRNMACAQAMSGRGQKGAFYAPKDPFGKERDTLDDTSFAIDHFSVKLLKLTAGMHTESAKTEAKRRHRFMLQFLFELAQEI